MPEERNDRARALVAGAMLQLSSQFRSKRRSTVFWSRVRDCFGVGSTSAQEICAEFGYDSETGERLETEKAQSAGAFYIQNRSPADVVIWWRAKGEGYTTDFADAGVFTEEEAQLIAGEHGRPEDRAIPRALADGLARTKTTVGVHALLKAIQSRQGWWQK